LDTSIERVEFVRQLYNLRHVLEREEESHDTEAKIKQFQRKIDNYNKGRMKSFHTNDTPGINKGKKRRRGNDNRGIHSSVFTAVLRPVLIFVWSRVLICVLKPLRKPCGLFTRQNVSELQGLAPKGG